MKARNDTMDVSLDVPGMEEQESGHDESQSLEWMEAQKNVVSDGIMPLE